MKFEQVPDIITGKDLEYLTDMFNYNYGAYKCMFNSIKDVKDEKIKKILEDSCDLFDDNMNIVLDIMGGFDE